MALDPYSQIINLLEDKWDVGNTDGITPTFTKLTDMKALDYRKSQDYVVMTTVKQARTPAGVGWTVYNRDDMFFLDIRSRGTSEAHHQLLLAEVERILEENFNLFTDSTNDYHLIDPDGERINRSDETHNIYRILLPVKLIKRSIQRGTQ